jgi:hypothetical protein
VTDAERARAWRYQGAISRMLWGRGEDDTIAARYPDLPVERLTEIVDVAVRAVEHTTRAGLRAALVDLVGERGVVDLMVDLDVGTELAIEIVALAEGRP